MAITLGKPGSPNVKTINLDSLFSLSMAARQKNLIDAISKTNPLFFHIFNSDAYQSEDGGTHIEVPLMYAINTAEPYDGYDLLDTTPIDGITTATEVWRQLSTAVIISNKEKKQNKKRIIKLLTTRITQAEMGFKESFNKYLIRGDLDNGNSIETDYTNPVTGRQSFHSINHFIQKDPTTSEEVSGINQSTSTWWRNRQAESSATTYDALLIELEELYDLCKRGQGGAPNLILCDEKTKRLINFALFQRYRTIDKSTADFPFDSIKFKGMDIVADEFVADVENDADTAEATAGSLYMLNTQFFGIKYESDTNFSSGAFEKPVNQDALISHILWMGQTVCQNREKQGVLWGIARTLT